MAKQPKAPKAAAKAAPKKQARPAAAMMPMSPRADLMPPSVEIRRREKRTISRLSVGLVFLTGAIVVASLGVTGVAALSEAALANENARKAQLLAEQKNYSEVVAVKALLGDYDAATMTALYSEANWQRTMKELDASMPDGVDITSEVITVKGVGDAKVEIPEVQLDEPGVVSIDFTALSQDVISSTTVLNRLAAMTGFASAYVSAVSESGEEGYTVTGRVELNAGALGGTTRVMKLDADQLTPLHEALLKSATQPPAPEPTDTASPDGESDETATEE